MNNAASNRFVGQNADCDLTLEQAGISPVHANLEIAHDGLISVVDNDSSNGIFLKRHDRWLRVKRITLCIGDCVRFAELEVPLEQLTAIFGEQSNARLEARHFAIQSSKKTAMSASETSHAAPTLTKPVRNPVTGKIEEQSS
jgi:hypothetical protein